MYFPTWTLTVLAEFILWVTFASCCSASSTWILDRDLPPHCYRIKYHRASEQPIQRIQEFHFGLLANSLVMRIFLKIYSEMFFNCILLEVSLSPFFILLYSYNIKYKIRQINLCFLFSSTLIKMSYFLWLTFQFIILRFSSI